MPIFLYTVDYIAANFLLFGHTYQHGIPFTVIVAISDSHAQFILRGQRMGAIMLFRFSAILQFLKGKFGPKLIASFISSLSIRSEQKNAKKY